MSSWLATPLPHVFNIGDFFDRLFRQASAVNSQQKNPAEAGAKLPQIV
jgi:hypothetical protein